MISEICKLTGGWLTFVSGDNCLRVYPNNISACSTHLRGTALGIRIKTKNKRIIKRLSPMPALMAKMLLKVLKMHLKKHRFLQKG